jgi:uncharacterized protein YndB with AHSA1/START domain
MTAESRPAAAQLTMPSETELVITRDFNAPRELVFDLFTKPEHVRRWWGLRGTTVPVCEIDLRVGGRWRWVLSVPDGGGEHAFSGTYLEIARPERLVRTEWYEAIPDSEYVATAEFMENAGGTTLRQHLKYKSVEFRNGHLQSGMEHGMNEAYDRADEVLEGLTRARR